MFESMHSTGSFLLTPEVSLGYRLLSVSSSLLLSLLRAVVEVNGRFMSAWSRRVCVCVCMLFACAGHLVQAVQNAWRSSKYL